MVSNVAVFCQNETNGEVVPDSLVYFEVIFSFGERRKLVIPVEKFNLEGFCGEIVAEMSFRGSYLVLKKKIY